MTRTSAKLRVADLRNQGRLCSYCLNQIPHPVQLHVHSNAGDIQFTDITVTEDRVIGEDTKTLNKFSTKADIHLKKIIILRKCRQKCP